MAQSDINQDLIRAIEEHSIVDVQRCLVNGANPNHTWTHDLGSNLNLSSLQPKTPLSLLVFLISDALLTEEDLYEYYEIAKILLDNGADSQPAIGLAKQRYGIYREPEKPSMFHRIYRLVSEAYSKIK